MAFSIEAITDVKGLKGIQDSYNTLVDKCGDNPFALYDFMRKFWEIEHSKGWNPIVLIGHNGNSITGMAPLAIKDALGIRLARFILQPYHTPDFVVKDESRLEFIDGLLDLVFGSLKCRFVDLVFPADGANFSVLRELCEVKGISCYTEPNIGRYVVPVLPTVTWEQFAALRGHGFRKRFGRIEKKLDKAGPWRIVHIREEADESDAFSKILAIDRASWKEDWRAQIGRETDPELEAIWKCARVAGKTTRGFTYSVLFLEVDQKPIAFAIILMYKRTGFITKTSFDEDYRAYSPGLVIWNAAVRTLFENKNLKEIDFETDLPFMRIWSSHCLNRTRVLLTKGFIPQRLMFFYRDRRSRRMLMNILAIVTNKTLG